MSLPPPFHTTLFSMSMNISVANSVLQVINVVNIFFLSLITSQVKCYSLCLPCILSFFILDAYYASLPSSPPPNASPPSSTPPFVPDKYANPVHTYKIWVLKPPNQRKRIRGIVPERICNLIFEPPIPYPTSQHYIVYIHIFSRLMGAAGAKTTQKHARPCE